MYNFSGLRYFYFVIKERHLRVINSYRQTFQEGNKVFSILFIDCMRLEGYRLHEKGLAEDKANPHLVFKIDEKKRISLDSK
jgi:hypothetical protein